MSTLTIGPQHHAEEALQVTVRHKKRLERPANVVFNDLVVFRVIFQVLTGLFSRFQLKLG
jgi:hypothetical protein